jgi:hypothetical protein
VWSLPSWVPSFLSDSFRSLIFTRKERESSVIHEWEIHHREDDKD